MQRDRNLMEPVLFLPTSRGAYGNELDPSTGYQTLRISLR
jgi:hypothetical protein